jgi:AmmeMemoRadiSam system protein B
MERAPAVAGTFYEAEPSALLGQVDGFLEVAGGNGRPLAASAVIAPHAGYAFCGAVLGQVYARVSVPDRVLILAPNHTGLGEAAAVSPAGFRTPLGTVPLDVGLAEALVASGRLAWDELAHAEEHSVEVHLPFLLRRNPAVRLTAVCLRTMSFAMCEEIGRIVADAVAAADSPVLLVASSDMNHHEPQRVASRKDRMALERIVEMDARGLYSGVVEHHVSMCGVVPTVVALVAARALGARHASVVAYANSGDVDGDYSSVVGYAGVLMQRERPRMSLRSFDDEAPGILGGCGSMQAGRGRG